VSAAEESQAQDLSIETSKIITTDEEIECFYAIKGMLIGLVSPGDLSYKDNERYFSVLYKNSIRKTICRINLDTKKKQIMIPDNNKDINRYYFDSLNDLYSFKDTLIKVVSGYVEK
jgi:hypothetical protein